MFALSEAEAEDSVFDAAYSFAIGQATEADVDTDGTTALSSAEYTYNSGKMLTGIVNPAGTVYGFTYDGFGRTLSVTIGGNNTHNGIHSTT